MIKILIMDANSRRNFGILSCLLIVISVIGCSEVGGQEVTPNSKSALKIEISISADSVGVCRDDGLRVHARIINPSKKKVAFYPDGIWSRLSYSTHDEIRQGVFQYRIRHLIGESRKDGDESMSLELKPGETVEYSKTLGLSDVFFASNGKYAIQIRYIDKGHRTKSELPPLFADDVHSNSAEFEIAECPAKQRP